MKKVTIVTSMPPSKGISKYSAALVEALAKNVQVEAISFRRLYPNFLYPGGSEDKSLRLVKKSKNIDSRNFLTWYNPFGWLYAGFTSRGEVLHIQWWTYVLAPIYFVILIVAKYIRRKRIIITVHNVRPHEKGVLKNIANRLIIGFGDHFIVHTEGGKKDFINEYKKHADRVSVVPHGMLMPDSGINGITKAEARKKLGIEDRREVLLFFGIIRQYKGVEVMLDALAKIKKSHKDALLVIAGKPWEDWQKYQDIIDKNNLSDSVLQKLEFIPEEDIEAYFVAADLVVFPYLHFDGQSGAGSLALSFGKAMVVTDVGGLPELVKNHNAIAKPKDANDLADKIMAVLSDGKLRKELEKDSLVRAKELSWDTIAEQTKSIYERYV